GKGKLLPQLENGSYLLDCSDLLLSELFKALEIGVFEGAGRVSGRIPLSITEDGVLTLGKMAFYSVPGGSETLKGILHENFSSGDPAYTFVADVMRNMKYDWVRLDIDPVPENGKYTLRISFRGKPGQALNYELAPGADGSAMIRKSETARNFGYLNLSLNLSLNLDPEKFRNAVRHLSR
ncbi:MAG: YdbH domain-containing protein, partial [Lentisphaeria bacterium]|nr:YdbH domain-containing protein [Lentisphaeria bacterium]